MIAMVLQEKLGNENEICNGEMFFSFFKTELQ